MRALVNRFRRLDDDGLVSHGVIVFVLSQLAGVANVFFHVVVGRTLSMKEYGVLMAMLSSVLTVWMPMMSLQNTFAHFTEHFRQEGRLEDVRMLISRWSVRLLIIAVGVFMCVLFGREHISGFFNIENAWLVVASTTCIVPALLLPVFVGVFQGAQKFVWMCAGAQGWGLVRLAVAALLMATAAPLAINGVLSHYMGLVGSLVIGIWGVALLLRETQECDKSNTETGCDRYFVLSFAGLLSFAVLMYADMVLVKHFFTAANQYGNYARASTIARSIVFLVLPITSAMFPKVVSRYGGTSAQRRTFVKALVLCAGLVASAVLMCGLLGGLMLRILFKVAAPDPELILLIRVLALAMSPLGLAFALMNFEMAQNRFLCVLPVAGCAVLYVGGVFVFHGSLMQVIAVLATAGVLSLSSLIAVTFLRKRG